MGSFSAFVMGIDLKAGGRVKKHCRSDPKSENIYLKLLVKLYKFLARRTDSKFNATILKRLCQSRTNKSPISVRKLQHFMKGKDGKIAVVVGAITNDVRFLDDAALKGITVCALRFTETARARLTRAGATCMSFDQLALKAPTGSNCILLRGPRANREACKYWGAPGVPGSSTKPKVAYAKDKGRKVESARGRRKSRGYKA